MDLTVFSSPDALGTAGADADTETLEGLVFRCGAYPEQGFALSEAEADALIADFAPVAARHGHPRAPGPLDGRLGTLTALWRQGTDLFGRAAVPRWLTALIPPEARKLSLGFSAAPKRIVEWSWVTDPAISDAALHAAFARFAGSRHNAGDQAMLNAAHDLVVHAGALCPSGMGRVARYAKEPPMSRFEQFMAWLNGAGGETVPVPDSPDPPAPAPAPDATFAAARDALAAREHALAAQEAQFARTRHQAQAELDVERLIRSGQIDPAENLPDTADGTPRLVALFAQALADDAAGTALFAQTGGGRYPALLAAYTARPARPVGQDAIPVTLLPTGDMPKPTEDAAARKRRNLERSPLGRSVLKQKEG